MTFGPATLTAAAAALLATIAYAVCKRLGANEYLTMFIYGLLLVLVVFLFPLCRLL